MPTQNRKPAPPGFYTARDAIATLNIPSASFYRLVKAGAIKATVLPGRKEAFYLKQAVDRHARAINAYVDKAAREISFYVALKEDLEEIHELLKANGSGVVPAIPASIMEAWQRRNPESIHVMRRGDETIGYFALFPLPYETIMQRMRGEIMHRHIPIEDIQPFVPGEPILLYVADAVVRLGENQGRVLGVRLLREMMRYLHRLAEQGIDIKELYTVGTSDYGIHICYSLGMRPMLDLPSGVSEKRVPFKLDMATSSAPDIVEYRRLLRAAQLVRE